MTKAHKIKIYPTKPQELLLINAAINIANYYVPQSMRELKPVEIGVHALSNSQFVKQEVIKLINI